MSSARTARSLSQLIQTGTRLHTDDIEITPETGTFEASCDSPPTSPLSSALECEAVLPPMSSSGAARNPTSHVTIQTTYVCK